MKNWETLRKNRRKTVLVTISRTTFVPEKYRVVDLETGDVWRWNFSRECWCRHTDRQPIKEMTSL